MAAPPSPPPPAPSTEELVQHLRFVRDLARALVRSPDEAEDLAQEAMLVAVRGTPPLRAGLRSWLRGVVLHLDRYRRRTESRRRTRETRAAAQDPTHTDPEMLGRAVVRDEQRRALALSVASLREPYRSIVVLRYYEDLTPSAIAERLGRPLATVKSQLQRGLGLLRAELERRELDSGPNATPWRQSMALLSASLDDQLSPRAPSTTSVLPWAAAVVIAGSWGLIEWTGAGTRPPEERPRTHADLVAVREPDADAQDRELASTSSTVPGPALERERSLAVPEPRTALEREREVLQVVGADAQPLDSVTYHYRSDDHELRVHGALDAGASLRELLPNQKGRLLLLHPEHLPLEREWPKEDSAAIALEARPFETWQVHDAVDGHPLARFEVRTLCLADLHAHFQESPEDPFSPRPATGSAAGDHAGVDADEMSEDGECCLLHEMWFETLQSAPDGAGADDDDFERATVWVGENGLVRVPQGSDLRFRVVAEGHVPIDGVEIGGEPQSAPDSAVPARSLPLARAAALRLTRQRTERPVLVSLRAADGSMQSRTLEPGVATEDVLAPGRGEVWVAAQEPGPCTHERCPAGADCFGGRCWLRAVTLDAERVTELELFSDDGCDVHLDLRGFAEAPAVVAMREGGVEIAAIARPDPRGLVLESLPAGDFTLLLWSDREPQTRSLHVDEGVREITLEWCRGTSQRIRLDDELLAEPGPAYFTHDGTGTAGDSNASLRSPELWPFLPEDDGFVHEELAQDAHWFYFGRGHVLRRVCAERLRGCGDLRLVASRSRRVSWTNSRASGPAADGSRWIAGLWWIDDNGLLLPAPSPDLDPDAAPGERPIDTVPASVREVTWIEADGGVHARRLGTGDVTVDLDPAPRTKVVLRFQRAGKDVVAPAFLLAPVRDDGRRVPFPRLPAEWSAPPGPAELAVPAGSYELWIEARRADRFEVHGTEQHRTIELHDD